MKPSKEPSKIIQYGQTMKRKHVIVHSQFRNVKNETEALLRHYRSMNHINRMATIPLLQKYSVAEHAYHVALLFIHYAELEIIKITVAELDRVLKHDILETVTGDLLLPVKALNTITKNAWKRIEIEILKTFPYLNSYCDIVMERLFTEKTLKLFKACDLLELYMFCMEEKRLGNDTIGIKTTLSNCSRIIQSYGFKSINDWLIGKCVVDSTVPF